MAGKWRQLAPHFLAMFVIYLVGFQVVSVVFEVQSFWVSLAIALAVAFLYPTVARSIGVAPEMWSEETG